MIYESEVDRWSGLVIIKASKSVKQYGQRDSHTMGQRTSSTGRGAEAVPAEGRSATTASEAQANSPSTHSEASLDYGSKTADCTHAVAGLVLAGHSKVDRHRCQHMPSRLPLVLCQRRDCGQKEATWAAATPHSRGCTRVPAILTDPQPIPVCSWARQGHPAAVRVLLELRPTEKILQAGRNLIPSV